MATLAEKLRRAKEDESGAALITTVGLMLFTFMVVIALMYSSIVAIKVDSSVRAGETLDSSFDSALNQALASATLGNPSSTTTGNTCVPAVAKNAQGASYQIYRTASATKPATVTTTGVSKGCPVNGDTYMMIETKSAGATKIVTSTYKWTDPQNGFDGHVAGTSAATAQVATFTGSTGDVTVTSGNYTCDGSTLIGGDLYVPNGTLTLSGSCTVTGDVYADNLVVKSSNVRIGYLSGGLPYQGDVRLTGSVTVASGVAFNLGNAGSLYSSGTDTLSLPAAPSTTSFNINAQMIVIKGGLTLAKGAILNSSIQVGGDVVTSGAATVDGYIRANGRINAASTSGVLSVSNFAYALSTAAYTMYNVDSDSIVGMGTPATTNKQSMSNVSAGTIYSYGTAANTFTTVKATGSIWIAGNYAGLTGTAGSVFSSKNSADNLLTKVTYTRVIGVNGTVNTKSVTSCTYTTVGSCTIFKGKANLYDDPTTISIPAVITWTVPTVQTWQDYSFKATDWVGYRIIKPSSCDYTAQAAVDQLNNLQSPTILDLRNCNTINFTGVSLKLKTSVAILSNSFSTSASSFNSAFTNMSVSGADTAVHAFYIINTDDTADGVPTCNNTTTGQLGLSNTNFGSTFRVVTYTPCATTVNYPAGSTWTGQIYSGVLTYNTFNIKYARVYIPGFPTTASSATTFSASASNRATPLLVDRVSTKPTNVS